MFKISKLSFKSREWHSGSELSTFTCGGMYGERHAEVKLEYTFIELVGPGGITLYEIPCRMCPVCNYISMSNTVHSLIYAPSHEINMTELKKNTSGINFLDFSRLVMRRT